MHKRLPVYLFSILMLASIGLVAAGVIYCPPPPTCPAGTHEVQPPVWHDDVYACPDGYTETGMSGDWACKKWTGNHWSYKAKVLVKAGYWDPPICEPDDLCPDDPNKTEPGACGCGVADTDLNENGIADCLEEPTPTPTELPPTEVPPTEVPPTEVPPTEVPPTMTPTVAPTATPEPTSTVAPTATPEPTKKSPVSLPSTGIGTDLIMVSVPFVLGGGGLVAAALTRRRRQ